MAKREKQEQHRVNPGAELMAAILGPGITAAGRAAMSPEDMIENLQQGGYRIMRDDPASEQRRQAVSVDFSKSRWAGGDVVKMGVVSCSHLGSRNQQLTALESFYDRVVEEKIPVVLNAGDVSDGDGHVYRGQTYDIFIHGADRQRGYIIDNYPQRSGVKTYAISGNHDWSFWQRGGVDILDAVAAKRSDFVYLGAMAAKIDVGGVDVYLAHGSGGGAYARSYKSQKRTEQFAPEQKPEVFLLGHYHSWNHMPMYRNVVVWMLGCFQSQTDYLKRLGLYPEIGGLILTIHKGTAGADRPGGFARVTSEIVPYYIPKTDDY